MFMASITPSESPSRIGSDIILYVGRAWRSAREKPRTGTGTRRYKLSKRLAAPIRPLVGSYIIEGPGEKQPIQERSERD